uniref:Uncharacterized protein n=1 Tax=Arundo donax TaxID=35708 RepID=A0A0A8ZPV8_ARUDO
MISKASDTPDGLESAQQVVCMLLKLNKALCPKYISNNPCHSQRQYVVGLLQFTRTVDMPALITGVEIDAESCPFGLLLERKSEYYLCRNTILGSCCIALKSNELLCS